MPVNLQIPDLQLIGKFQDYRDPILGDSYNWGPAIDPNRIDGFVFHHSVTPQTAKNDGNWKTECDRIAQEHINGNGWGGIGYRFIICSDGTVAYVGDLSHGGSAVADNNDHLFSACLIGDFTKELPTAAQVHSAHLLAKFFLTQAPQYPNLNNFNQIKGHKEYNPTACPGSNWKGVDDSLYNRIIEDRWQGYPLPEPKSTTSSGTTSPSNPPIPSSNSKADQLVSQIKQIVWGKGWIWSKINKIKVLLPK